MACDERAALLDTALAARPDVRAAELELEAAGARAGLERARVMTLSAMLDANAQGREGFEMGPGLAIELPVFSRNQGGKARAAAELDQAARRYLAVRAKVAADVDDALIQYRQAAEAADLLEGTLDPSLETAQQQAERLYEAGEISLIDMLTTQRHVVDAERARLEAGVTRQRGLIALERALGWSCRAPQ
jgi:cobalt-zinc-cadmium efflux system outer membrane protein